MMSPLWLSCYIDRQEVKRAFSIMRLISRDFYLALFTQKTGPASEYKLSALSEDRLNQSFVGFNYHK